jgi:PIN domain nuclease of toxin-antitoxin system
VAENYLLDTHALIWATYEPQNLSRKVRSLLQNDMDGIFVSAVSAMEITTKFRRGKLDLAETLARDFVGETLKDGYRHLSLTVGHGEQGGKMPIPHQDPWDRLLIAQAQIENMSLISNERLFDSFGVSRFW